MLPNTGLVISLNSDCIALVPLWPKSMAVSQILSQLVEVAILELTWVLQSSRRVVWSESSSSSLIPLGEKQTSKEHPSSRVCACAFGLPVLQ